MDISEFAKTMEGVKLIEAQFPFCVDGRVWQGHNGAAFRVEDSQLADHELEHIRNVGRDIDSTLDQVIRRRLQQLESRHDRKSQELMARRAELRTKRNSIRESIRADAAQGIPAPPDDVDEMEQIDVRMQRLSSISKEERKRSDRLKALLGPGEAPPDMVQDPESVVKPATGIPRGVVTGAYSPACPECGSEPPADHSNKALWLRGHMAGAHRQKVPKTAEPEGLPDLRHTATG